MLGAASVLAAIAVATAGYVAWIGRDGGIAAAVVEAREMQLVPARATARCGPT